MIFDDDDDDPQEYEGNEDMQHPMEQDDEDDEQQEMQQRLDDDEEEDEISAELWQVNVKYLFRLAQRLDLVLVLTLSSIDFKGLVPVLYFLPWVFINP